MPQRPSVGPGSVGAITATAACRSHPHAADAGRPLEPGRARMSRTRVSDAARLCGKRLALLFVVASVGVIFARPAEALVGDMLWAVNIPAAAKCGDSSGTAVAVVPGGKLNFPKIQTVLVTSCVQAGQAKLFF